MRIQQLDLRAFGRFTDVTLDLSEGQCGVHLIVGPNEAGKSTTLRALRQMLFGFDHLISDHYLHNEKTLRVGGTLRDESGHEIAFLRRRGRKNTLRSPDDSADLPEESLTPFLGPLTEKLFETQFGLDRDRLSISSKEMRESGGELGRLLFGVGLDLGTLREFQTRLGKDADDLFTSSRAPSKQIPKLIQEYKSACAALRDHSLPVAQWTEAQEELARLHEERRQLDASVLAANRERSRLGRIEVAIPDVTRRGVLRAEADALKDAAVLRADFADDRRAIDEAHRAAARARDDAREALASVSTELESVHVADDILGREAAIVELHGRSDRYAKGTGELIGLRVEAQQMKDRISEILRDLGRPDDLETARSYMVKRIERSSINNLIFDDNSLQVELKEAEKQFAGAETEVAALQESFDDLPETRDTAALERALKAALKLGEIEKSIQSERSQLKRAEAAWEADRSRLSIGLSATMQLEAAPIPSAETIERYAKRLEALESEAARLRNDLAALRKQAKTHQRQLTALQKHGDIPTVADLNHARTARDEAWNRVKGVWSWALIEEFENAQSFADQIGDRLRNEAERVFDLVQRTEAVRASEEDCAAAQKALEDADGRLEEASRQWRQLWEGLLDGEPLSPREMESWRQHRERLIAELPRLAESRDRIDEHQRQADEARAALLDAAAALDAPITRAKSLASVLEHAQELLERFHEQTRVRTRLSDQLGTAKKAHRDARQARIDVERRITDWGKAWSRKLAALGFDGETTTGQVSEILKSLDELSAALNDLDRHAQRIVGLERDQSEFEAQARDLLDAVAPDLLDEPPATAVKVCWGRFDLAKSAKNRRDGLIRDREKLEGSIRTALHDLSSLEARRKALCEEAGCDDPAELPEREEQSARRRAIQSELSEIDDRLSRLTGGQPLDAFVKEAAGHDLDEVHARRLNLDAEITLLDERNKGLLLAQGAVQNQIDAMNQRSRDGKALGSSADAQHLLAKIANHVDQYSRLRLASAILGQVIERYRQRHQGPLLSKAGAFFQDLTGGAFVGLRSDLDDHGKPRLVGLRGPQKEQVEIEGMSTGTVDQLYLALKLASLEHYLDHNPAMPLILDDVLVQFDDDRSLAALRAFATFSARTQVIFFTHHRHLAELARRELPRDVLFVHSLEPRSAAAS